MNDNNLIEENNLSKAWAKAFLRLMKSSGGSISPLIVSVQGLTNNSIPEDEKIRNALSEELCIHRESKIDTIAGTIFPTSFWNHDKKRKLLYERYLRCWPRIKKSCSANRRGTYFYRLIEYGKNNQSVNQLEHIISTWQLGTHRHSALQASIFNPELDHTKQRQLGFPCLQQISLNAQGTNGRDGLTIVGFYANQHIFEKAYGNYLGLSLLGQFLAQEMGLYLKEMICISSVAKLGNYSKNSLKNLEDNLKNLFPQVESK